jgi:hypothetical protein
MKDGNGADMIERRRELAAMASVRGQMLELRLLEERPQRGLKSLEALERRMGWTADEFGSPVA